MNGPLDWQSGFLAVSALLGEPLDVAAASLPAERSAGAAELLRELTDPSRANRARAMARVTTTLLAALDDGSFA